MRREKRRLEQDMFDFRYQLAWKTTWKQEPGLGFQNVKTLKDRRSAKLQQKGDAAKDLGTSKTIKRQVDPDLSKILIQTMVAR